MTRRLLRPGTVASFAVLAFLFALPLRGLLRGQGPPMEEGFMLVFPERVLRGDVANRDFLHLYGPGSLWVLAAAFKTLGTSLTTERLVGLAQHVGVVSALYALARPWGRLLATLCGAIALFIIVPPAGLVALAWTGAMALAAWAVWAALRARDEGGRYPVVAGLLAGLALLYRPDLIVAVGAGVLVALWGVEWERRRRFLVGLGVGLAPYLVHLATAGPYTAIKGMILDPVVYLRGGRRLPIPPPTNYLGGFLQRVGEFDLPSWPLPTLRTPMQMFVWFWLMLGTVAALVLIGVLLHRRAGDLRSRTILAVAVLSVGMLPQGLQRTDNTHFAWASTIPIAFLPVALVELQRRLLPRWRPNVHAAIAGVAVLVAVVALIPTYTVRRYGDYVQQTFDHHRVAYPIVHDGRTFYYGRRDVQDAMREMLPVVDKVAPKHGRLFVGPHDLRFTPYSEAFLYYLFPNLTPATYYIEMDPGVANRKGSRMTSDLASADVVILSRVWYNWVEPNDSRKVGSSVPQHVLETEFCKVGFYGSRRDRADAPAGAAPSGDAPPGAPLFELYRKCH